MSKMLTRQIDSYVPSKKKKKRFLCIKKFQLKYDIILYVFQGD